MIFISKDRYTFIPKINGNRNVKSEEKISCEIIRPKVEERNELFSMDVERELSAKAVEDTRAAVTFKRRYNVSRILRVHIGEIQNLEIKSEGGKVSKIKTGAELADCTAFGIASLIDELCLEVISDTLTEDEKKS